MKETRSGFLMTQIKQVGGRRFNKMLADSGIDAFNGAQGRILYVLWQQEGVSISELAKATGLAKPTLTSMLDRMEQSGLVRREAAPGDRRRTLLKLTDNARALREDYERISDAMSELYFKGFDDCEIDQFESYLLRVLENLEGGYENE